MQLAPLILLGLGACTGSNPKPSDSGDSGADTAETIETAESSESAETDSGGAGDSESGETSDTDDSADSGDTGEASPFVASDVPGWDDYNCAEEDPVATMSFTFPDVFTVTGVFLAGQPSAGPHFLTVQLHDCVYFACDGSLDTTLPYTEATADGTWGDAGIPRALGVWGPDDTAPRYVEGLGNSPFGPWSDTTYGWVGEVTVCVERMRPDEIRGVVRVSGSVTDYTYDDYYDILDTVLRFPFSVQLDDHAGFDTTLPDTGTAPPGYSTAHFEYDVPYDDAWPWDQITDKKVRQELHDRYTPYNTP